MQPIKTYFKTLAVVLALTVMAAIAVSQTVHRAHMRGNGMFGGPMLGFYMHKLDLNDDQQAQLKAIMTKEKPSIQPLLLQMAQGHAQLRDLVINGGYDEAKVRELATQQSQTMTELTVQYARIGSEMVQVLTPEQKSKLTELIKQRQQRMLESHAAKDSGRYPNSVIRFTKKIRRPPAIYFHFHTPGGRRLTHFRKGHQPWQAKFLTMIWFCWSPKRWRTGFRTPLIAG